MTASATFPNGSAGPAQLATTSASGELIYELTTAGDVVTSARLLSASRLELGGFTGALSYRSPSVPFPLTFPITVSDLVLRLEGNEFDTTDGGSFNSTATASIEAGTVELPAVLGAPPVIIGDSFSFNLTGRFLRPGGTFRVSVSQLSGNYTFSVTDTLGAQTTCSLTFDGTSMIGDSQEPVPHPATGATYFVHPADSIGNARLFALLAGGNLVAFDSPGEELWVQNNLALAAEDHFIGLDRQSGQAPWFWFWGNGQLLIRTHCIGCVNSLPPWAPGQPDNASGDETLVTVSPTAGTWSDVAASTIAPAILEFSGYYRTFGVGCGPGLPALNARTRPRIDRVLAIGLSDLPVAAPCGVLFRFGAASAPVDLSPIGMPGCTLYASPNAAIAGMTDTSGTFELEILLPDDPTLIGLEFSNQAAFVAPSFNALGVGLTNGGEGIIGE